MATKVAINGFGRIGRLVFRAAVNDPELEVVAINDLGDINTMAHLFKYDSVHGRVYDSVTVDGDVITADGHYLGGNISPGVEMRLEALHARTARLPRIEADGDTPDVGYDTTTAIRAGVVRGIGY